MCGGAADVLVILMRLCLLPRLCVDCASVDYASRASSGSSYSYSPHDSPITFAHIARIAAEAGAENYVDGST